MQMAVPARRVPVAGRGDYAIRALPDLCGEIVSERLETQVPLGFSLWLDNSKPRHARGFFFTAGASPWRTPPSRPRASARSRAWVCGPRAVQRRVSTATAAHLPNNPC
jgi:hypothetical protein